ncbi:MAG: hypothetical protein ACI4JU_01250, partial [Angelakisella sp.]
SFSQSLQTNLRITLDGTFPCSAASIAGFHFLVKIRAGPAAWPSPFYRKKPLLQNGAGAFGVFAREKIKPAR